MEDIRYFFLKKGRQINNVMEIHTYIHRFIKYLDSSFKEFIGSRVAMAKYYFYHHQGLQGPFLISL